MVESSEISLELIVAAGTAGMLLLVVFIVLFVVLYQRKISRQQEAHQRNLFEAAIQTQEEERKRIATDLHDDLQQQFSTVRMAVEKAAEELEGVSPLAKSLKAASAMAADTIIALRRISYDLMPKGLSKEGLAYALNELCVRLSETGIKAQFTRGGDCEHPDAKTELALYRVVQELVNNTLKHAEATRIEMVMNCSLASRQDGHGRCILMISDNGKGFDAEKEKDKGLGMRNIESRLSMIGATYHFESEPGEGTMVTIVLETKSDN